MVSTERTKIPRVSQSKIIKFQSMINLAHQKNLKGNQNILK